MLNSIVKAPFGLVSQNFQIITMVQIKTHFHAYVKKSGPCFSRDLKNVRFFRTFRSI